MASERNDLIDEDELTCKIGNLNIGKHSEYEEGEHRNEDLPTKKTKKEGYTFCMQGATSVDDVVLLKPYTGRSYEYANNRFRSELVYPVLMDPPSSLEDERDGLFGTQFLNDWMTSVRNLAGSYTWQNNGRIRVVLRFGHLHWGARNLTNSELTYARLLKEIEACHERRELRNSEAYGRDASRGRGGRGRSRGRGRGSYQPNWHNKRVDEGGYIQSTFFHPGGQQIERLEEWLALRGFEQEDVQERCVCNFTVKENKTKCDLMLDKNLKLLYCRLNKHRWNSTNIKTINDNPDIRIHLETVRIVTVDDMNEDPSLGLKTLTKQRPILKYADGPSDSSIVDKCIQVDNSNLDGEVHFVRLRERKQYLFSPIMANDPQYKSLSKAKVKVGKIREFEKYSYEISQFMKVNNEQPEVTVTLTELPDWQDEQEWQNVAWSLYKFAAELVEIL